MHFGVTVQLVHPADGLRLQWRILRKSAIIIQQNLWNLPIPLAAKQLQDVMPAWPCLTVHTPLLIHTQLHLGLMYWSTWSLTNLVLILFRSRHFYLWRRSFSPCWSKTCWTLPGCSSSFKYTTALSFSGSRLSEQIGSYSRPLHWGYTSH